MIAAPLYLCIVRSALAVKTYLIKTVRTLCRFYLENEHNRMAGSLHVSTNPAQIMTIYEGSSELSHPSRACRLMLAPQLILLHCFRLSWQRLHRLRALL